MDELVGASSSAAEQEVSEGVASGSGTEYKEIIVARDGGLVTITLNRPKKYNALNYQVYLKKGA